MQVWGFRVPKSQCLIFFEGNCTLELLSCNYWYTSLFITALLTFVFTTNQSHDTNSCISFEQDVLRHASFGFQNPEVHSAKSVSQGTAPLSSALK
jgi:hypothetical protein